MLSGLLLKPVYSVENPFRQAFYNSVTLDIFIYCMKIPMLRSIGIGRSEDGDYRIPK
jgi:hypothetical protein